MDKVVCAMLALLSGLCRWQCNCFHRSACRSITLLALVSRSSKPSERSISIGHSTRRLAASEGESAPVLGLERGTTTHVPASCQLLRMSVLVDLDRTFLPPSYYRLTAVVLLSLMPIDDSVLSLKPTTL